MYAMNIQNDVIGLVLHQNCKSKQVTDFIAWPSRCHDTKWKKNIFISGSINILSVCVYLGSKQINITCIDKNLFIFNLWLLKWYILYQVSSL
jgi:hypothetical protein